MPLDEFIIFIYIWIDKNYNQIIKEHTLRKSGFQPKLSDAEVITMEIVGEFLGIDTDKQIHNYFHQHWHTWFPKLNSRSQFSKQAANLMMIKSSLLKSISIEIGAMQDSIHIVDGFPIPICHLNRSYRCKRYEEDACHGHCASKNENYYGFKGHLLIDFNGGISGFELSGATTDERKILWEILKETKGLVLADKGYISMTLKEELERYGIQLETPLRSNMKEMRSKKYVKQLMKKRRLVETVISQLTEHFNIAKVWARDLWHLSSRIYRKLLSHSLAVWANRSLGRHPLEFDGLIK